MRFPGPVFVLSLTLLLQATAAGFVCAHGPSVEAEAPAAALGKEGHEHETPLSGDAGKAPKEWVVEKSGALLPLDLVFRDEEGQPIRLDQIVDKPFLLLPVYYYCAGSCSRNLANLAVSLSRMKSSPGRDFQVIAFSINDRESNEDARRAKKTFLKLAGREFPEAEWRFLTGDRKAITALTAAIGYRFEQRADGTLIHPSALVAATKSGRVIRYVYGDFIPGDVDMAVYDAGRNTPSLSVKRLLDICFNRDPNASKGVVLAVKGGVFAAFGLVVAAILLRYRHRGGGRRRSEGRNGTETG